MTSPTLAELQRSLTARVLDRQVTDRPDVAIENFVSVPAGVDVSTRLGVYTGGYPARIAEALIEAFPAVAKILGDGSLASLVER